MQAIGTILKDQVPTIESMEHTCDDISEYLAMQCKWYNELISGNLKGYDCPICKNKGDIRVMNEKGNDYHLKKCECMKKRKSLESVERSGLKNLIDEYTFDTYEANEEWQKEVKKRAKAFADRALTQKDYTFFFLGGQVGSGKTHICTAITTMLLNGGYETRYLDWNEGVRELNALITEDKEAYFEKLNTYKSIDVLYIDDFFKTKAGESVKSAEVDRAFEIINHRYNKKLITVISSERTINEIINDIDEALGSRIKQRCKCFCLNIGKDIKKNYRLRENN